VIVDGMLCVRPIRSPKDLTFVGPSQTLEELWDEIERHNSMGAWPNNATFPCGYAERDAKGV